MADDETVARSVVPRLDPAILQLDPERVAACHAWLREFHGTDRGGSVRLAVQGPQGWCEVAPILARDLGVTHGELLAVLARSLVAASATDDCFVVPYPHRPRASRRKGCALARTHVHADVDGALDLGRLRALGGFAVASGGVTPEGQPKAHAFVRLTESVPAAAHERLCRAFGALVGGTGHDTSKVGDADYLRPPGTLHHKTGEGRPVAWLVRPDDPSVRARLPGDLARLLRVPWPVPDDDAAGVLAPLAPVTSARSAGRFEGRLRRLGEATEGERNSLLFWCAKLAGAEDAGPEADAAMLAVARELGLPDSEARATVASGRRHGGEYRAEVLGQGDLYVADAGAVDQPQPTPEPARQAPGALREIAPGVRVDDAAEAGFWAARPALAAVRDCARARRVSPWATLGAVLARVVGAVPPSLRLPPVVAAPASLNLFVALVGESSAGKGGALAVAAEVLGAVGGVPFEVLPLGSGEGIAHAFAIRKRGGDVQRVATSVLFELSEVDTLAGLTERRGGTLLPELRKAWSGERLGFAYADKTKRLPIDAHSYRLGLLAAVQPQRAGVLLGDADGGLPQRFVWLPATDSGALDAEAVPVEPPPLNWRPPAAVGERFMAVCETARREIVAARVARLRGEGGALDGHVLLCRLKVAAALALLDQRADVTDSDWHLAGVVMDVSAATRGRVVEVQATEAARANMARGRAEGQRAALVAEAVEAGAVARVGRWVMARLGREPEGLTGAALRRAMAGRDRPHLAAALDALEASGQVVAETVEHRGQGGARYRAAGAAS